MMKNMEDKLSNKMVNQSEKRLYELLKRVGLGLEVSKNVSGLDCPQSMDSTTV